MKWFSIFVKIQGLVYLLKFNIMVIKSGHISNPLTIIAIFAGLAEIGGTVVLPLLSEKNQFIFIWYVMLFPILLVIIFFYILYKKNHVLYSPSDYQNDESFLKAKITFENNINEGTTEVIIGTGSNRIENSIIIE